MRRTTVYLPDELTRALDQMSSSTGRSKAELIREAITAHTAKSVRRPPVMPLFASGDPISERVDELLGGGFGLD